MSPHLILASQSIGRKKLLKYLQIPFDIIPSRVDEEKITGTSPLETIRLRARAKGEEVALRIQNSLISNQYKSTILPKPTTDSRQLTTIFISADSGAIIGDKLIGKPKDEADAYRILHLLSGRTHEFISAVYITEIRLTRRKNPTRPIIRVVLDDYDRSFVTFRKLTDEDIKLYLKITNYTKFAGGYAISSAQNFITKIHGSLSNVIGLPLEKVTPILLKHHLL